METEIKKLIKQNSDPDLVKEALEFAREAYKDKHKISGENYIKHAKRTALGLNRMKLDKKTIIAGLLHDVLDDKPSSLKKLTLKKISSKFGKEVAFLINKVSEASAISYPLVPKTKKETRFSKEKIENLRKMFFAVAEDLRVILIELSSRIDNLNSLNHLPPQRQKLYALETLNIFVPVADRLGMEKVKSKLEDPAFYYLLPDKFKWLEENIKEKYEQRQNYLESFTPRLKRRLKKHGIKVQDINYRAKSYWSTYQKFLEKDKGLDEIHDLVALRIIVPTVKDCYKTLGIIHEYYKPLSEEIDDFIANPKPNGYKSLHTTVFSDKGEITEMQIRTPKMHQEAEYGICAHWAYKQKINLKKEKKNVDWTKQIPKILKTYKIDFFNNRVFVFTPRGDVINLPQGATAVDFAYIVHTDIGNHCDSVKINGKLTSLSETLKNGDIVEIIIDKKKEPSPDWLKFVKTSLAKTRIKKYLRKTESPLRRPLAAIKRKVSSFLPKKEPKPAPKKEKKKLEVSLAGEKGSFMVRIAKCCSPKPGDKIQAYITKNRGASLHKPSCKNFQRLSKKFPHKAIEASWTSGES